MKFFIIMLFIISCETSTNPEYKKSKIIERVANLEETPEWANGIKTMWVEKNKVYFVHSTDMSGDARPSACLKAASLGAKIEMLKFLKENIVTSGQFNESDAISDPAYESLTSFLNKGNISGAAVSKKYWEKVEVSETSGERKLKLRCVAKVSIKKSDLERQLKEATKKDSKGNKEVREKLIKAQTDFIEGLAD